MYVENVEIILQFVDIIQLWKSGKEEEEVQKNVYPKEMEESWPNATKCLFPE